MTSEQFAKWRKRHFRSVSACATALGLQRDAVIALETGKTRKGTDYPVRKYIELACFAWAAEVRDYDGKPIHPVHSVTRSEEDPGDTYGSDRDEEEADF